MQIETYKSLKSFNTFGIECRARYFVSVSTVEELKEAIAKKPPETELFILGGGSNMLLTKDLDAYVIHVNLKGIRILKETNDSVLIQTMAGENWHEFVLFCIQNNFGGVENLSLIPGNVGTAPIQNIGAYGVELEHVFVNCSALEVNTLETRVFTKEELRFGYRDSIFKNEAKGKFVITDVTFRLSKTTHEIHNSYGAIRSVLREKNIVDPTIKDISDAVIQIRQSKLPDPKILGNSGSFFKNPIVDIETFKDFKDKFPEAPYYEVSPTHFKIPAGWLIEHSGFKGKRFGDAGVHKHQALVLVNYGTATGKEIWDLAEKIQKTVRKKTGIFIVPEVNVF